MDSATGFGLGLSIARAVIEAHGGGLTLANRAPCGLVATITLPCGTDKTPEPSPQPTAYIAAVPAKAGTHTPCAGDVAKPADN